MNFTVLQYRIRYQEIKFIKNAHVKLGVLVDIEIKQMRKEVAFIGGSLRIFDKVLWRALEERI